MKVSTIILVSLLLTIFTSVEAEENFFTNKNAYIQPKGPGCTIEGIDKVFQVGERTAMNHKELKTYKEKTGYQASDGYAVIMACLFLVDPLSTDYPAVKDRKYVWVAY